MRITKQYIAFLTFTLFIGLSYSQTNKGTWGSKQWLAPFYVKVIQPKVGDTITFISRDSVTEIGTKQTSSEFKSVEFDLKFNPEGKVFHYELNKNLKKGKWKRMGNIVFSEKNKIKISYKCPNIKGSIWLKSNTGLVHNSKWIVTKVSLIV